MIGTLEVLTALAVVVHKADPRSPVHLERIRKIGDETAWFIHVVADEYDLFSSDYRDRRLSVEILRFDTEVAGALSGVIDAFTKALGTGLWIKGADARFLKIVEGPTVTIADAVAHINLTLRWLDEIPQNAENEATTAMMERLQLGVKA